MDQAIARAHYRFLTAPAAAAATAARAAATALAVAAETAAIATAAGKKAKKEVKAAEQAEAVATAATAEHKAKQASIPTAAAAYRKLIEGFRGCVQAQQASHDQWFGCWDQFPLLTCALASATGRYESA
jgi:hypothetical protein